MSNIKAVAAKAAADAIRAKLMKAGKLTVHPNLSGVAPEPLQPDDIVLEVDINDNPNRALLTQFKKQEELANTHGVIITTRGRFYMAAEKAARKPHSEKPLHLHITSKIQGNIDKAQRAIETILNIGTKPPALPPAFVKGAGTGTGQLLPLPAPFGGNLAVPGGGRPPPFMGGKKVSTRVYVDVDLEPYSTFDLKAKVAGVGNAFLGHIRNETSCKVTLKGLGSGTIENASQKESHEPLNLHIEGHDRHSLESARKLCEDLVATVRNEYAGYMRSTGAAPVNQPQQQGGYPAPYGQPQQQYHGGYAAPPPQPPQPYQSRGYPSAATPNAYPPPPLPPGATAPPPVPEMPDLPAPSKRKFSEKKSYRDMPAAPPPPVAPPPLPPPPKIPSTTDADSDERTAKKPKISLVDYGDDE